ncbi:MAG: hypothetical protein MUC80_08490 [Candidatus Thermoplasmatota archaeon]|jgi:hypothetical protein|nr:hypothetical protein [Candidatus Thermoplasmatota archaeon]
MKKTVIAIVVGLILLSMPTILAIPAPNRSSLFSPLVLSDGTFAGGFGRGHWGNGNFNIDTTYAYMSGVYSGGAYIKISGNIDNAYGEKIGDINAMIGFKIIFGSTTLNGLKTPIFGFLMRHQNNQFIGRIISITLPVPHMWGYLIPNK